MYNAQNWEKWVNKELLHQLAAKGKIDLPKGEATERYDRNFHMTNGRILLPHDHSLLHEAECRIRYANNARKGTDRNVLKKKLNGLQQQLDIEKRARMDLEATTTLNLTNQSASDKAAAASSSNEEIARHAKA